MTSLRESAIADKGEFQYNLTDDGELVPTSGGAAKGTPAPAPTSPPIDLSHLHKAPRQMQLSRGPVGSPLAGAGAGGGSGPFAQPQHLGGGGARPPQTSNDVDKVGRNDPCPCGSGKKYKKCHGQDS